LLAIPLALSTFTHMWNTTGFPDLFYDEGIYMRRAMHVLDGLGPQESYYHDHPYFGQLFLAGVFKIIGYPNLLNSSVTTTKGNIHSIKMLYLIPRILMGILAVIDTFLVYKISERRYDRNVAFIASVLFAIMPITWLIRRILLDTIQLPFLLSSILFAVYYTKDLKSSSNNNKRIISVLLSGIFLGLSIFTKVPVFTMIPLVSFLIFTNNNRNLKTLGLWFIPVILIPLLWPAQGIMSGQFSQWLGDILWETQRQNGGFSSAITFFVQVDPALLLLGTAGLIFAAIKRDSLLLLWVIPFIIFLSVTGFVQYFYWIPILPAFSIATARIIAYLAKKRINGKKLQQIVLFVITSGIGIFGLVSTTALVISNVSSQFEAAAFVAKYLQINNNNNNITVISSPIYSWIFSYIYNSGHVFPDYRDLLFYPIQTKKILLIADHHFKSNMGSGEQLQTIYNNTTIIATFNGGVIDYDLGRYPFTSMIANYEGSIVEIRVSK
jgi:hypothetical protein